MSNTFLQELENKFNYKFTENGAIAMESTGSKVYDLFAFGGAYRSRSTEDKQLLFKKAYEEDPNLALKCLFYLRDIRGGQGERQFFRDCLKWLIKADEEAAAAIMDKIPEYGRWDDLEVYFGTSLEKPMLAFLNHRLVLDITAINNNEGEVSLLGKWLPSENTSSFETRKKAKKVRQFLELSSAEYRKMLSKLRKHLNIVEKLMSQGQWDQIEFDKIPSKAGLIYRNAFTRHDVIKEKYLEFIENKDTTVNADTLYPYEIVNKVTHHLDWHTTITNLEKEVIEKYWNNQKDYFNGKPCNLICVIDTSGSMTWCPGKKIAPIDVAISLGMYAAERNRGPFKDYFISFSSRPQLIKITGIDFVHKVSRIYQQNLCENTNLEATFDCLLQAASRPGVKKEDIPETIVVISDMEIDRGSEDKALNNRYLYRDTDTDALKNGITLTMSKIKRKWAAAGIKMPKLVYWNVDARQDTVLDIGPDVSLVSGASPVIFQMVMTGKQGIELMLEKLLSSRYDSIHK